MSELAGAGPSRRPPGRPGRLDLHASGGGNLSGGRAELFERSVQLLLDRWNDARDIRPGLTVSGDLGMTPEEMRRPLEHLAHDVHGRPAGSGTDSAHISLGELWEHLDRHRNRDHRVDQRAVSDYLHQRSGILVADRAIACREGAAGPRARAGSSRFSSGATANRTAASPHSHDSS